MKRIYIWLILINLIAGISYLIYFDEHTMRDCGRTDSKPLLALGLSPSWFDGKFQLRKGYKEIISSSDRDKPFSDKWVKGSEQFKTIVAYDNDVSDSGVFFKALGWDDIERTYILREYDSTADENYIYDVTLIEKLEPNSKWVKVDQFSCREGVYGKLPYLFILLIVVVNIIVIFKLIRRIRLEKE